MATRLAGPSPAAAYAWPLALAETTTALTYALAGVAKVAGSGWADGSVLRDQIAVGGVCKQVLGKAGPATLAISLVMRITFRYQLSGVAYAPTAPTDQALVSLLGRRRDRPR